MNYPETPSTVAAKAIASGLDFTIPKPCAAVSPVFETLCRLALELGDLESTLLAANCLGLRNQDINFGEYVYFDTYLLTRDWHGAFIVFDSTSSAGGSAEVAVGQMVKEWSKSGVVIQDMQRIHPSAVFVEHRGVCCLAIRRR